MKANLSGLIVWLAVLGLVSLLFMRDRQPYLTLSQLKAKQDVFAVFYAGNRGSNPLGGATVFFKSLFPF